jgi:hypothetical protein
VAKTPKSKDKPPLLKPKVPQTIVSLAQAESIQYSQVNPDVKNFVHDQNHVKLRFKNLQIQPMKKTTVGFSHDCLLFKLEGAFFLLRGLKPWLFIAKFKTETIRI